MLLVTIQSEVLTSLPQTFHCPPAFPQSKHYFSLSPEVFVGLTPQGKSQFNSEEGVCVHTCAPVCRRMKGSHKGKSHHCWQVFLLLGVCSSPKTHKCCERCSGTTETSPGTTWSRLSGLPAQQPSKHKRLMAGAQNWTGKGR